MFIALSCGYQNRLLPSEQKGNVEQNADADTHENVMKGHNEVRGVLRSSAYGRTPCTPRYIMKCDSSGTFTAAEILGVFT